uniref:Heterogeneous nuclear ribonucleoprotein A3 homolog 2-like n=1 Tax=Phallusia mammillata TaxID=59560 RepID=A0A6F9DDX5_9ASCI|nr:heterogeneous nuclear ribonucleoprotein A3 homolog 2-like [Phallusia mammillata]
MPYSSGKEEEQSRKLFVGGISQETTDEAMNEYFSKFGAITDCVVIREQSTNRSKGFGFVTFETETEADKCMDKRPHSLDGRQIDVKRAVSREESSKPGAHVQVKKIFIGGIKEGCDENALKEYFGKFGSINSCEIPRNNEQRPKGFAFITFNDFDIVDKLVAKRHHMIAGTSCEVKKALSKQEMEKAKQQLEIKQQSRPRRGGGSGGGGSNLYGNGNQGYGGYDGYDSGDYNNGYGSYGDGYGSYGSYSDGYGSGYGGNSSGYGPMKGQYGQQQSRASGPYGGGYGSGSYNAGGGSDSGYGGYGSYSQGYGSGGGSAYGSSSNSGYGSYTGQNQSGSSGRGRGRGKY